MTYLILMLTVAAAMTLFREPLGRGLVRFAEAVDWKQLAVLAVVLVLYAVSLHYLHVGIAAPLPGDLLAALVDITVTYTDLVIGAAGVLFNWQSRQLLGRLARLTRQLIFRCAGRAARAPAKPRRRLPDREEPEPSAWRDVWGFA